MQASASGADLAAPLLVSPHFKKQRNGFTIAILQVSLQMNKVNSCFQENTKFIFYLNRKMGNGVRRSKPFFFV